MKLIYWSILMILCFLAVSSACFAEYTGEIIFIPAGSFQMGNSNVGNDAVYHYYGEFPQHSVTLSDYYIGKYEVTRGEYRAFMTATGRAAPAYWDAIQDWGTGSFTQTDNHPVVGVTWYDAEAFCAWAGGHLPTEAQWEKAARWTGSSPNVYPWGNTWDFEMCNNYYDHNSAGGGYGKYQTAPVGSYPGGASPYGCQDMAGNVWEWCQDWYKSYPGSSSPFDYTNSFRVLRGGIWDGDDHFSRCADRNPGNPSYGNIYFGFRLTRDAVPFMLSCTVHLGDYSGAILGIPVTIDLLNEDGSTILRTENTTLNADGKFYIDNVQPGTYKLGIKPSHWLRKVTGPVTVSNADVDFVIQ